MVGKPLRPIEQILADTEVWCRRAAACGPEYRLYRSLARFEKATSGGEVCKISFRILGPDEPAPTIGYIFGPWDDTRHA